MYCFEILYINILIEEFQTNMTNLNMTLGWLKLTQIQNEIKIKK